MKNARGVKATEFEVHSSISATIIHAGRDERLEEGREKIGEKMGEA
jgi:hypothetical protein